MHIYKQGGAIVRGQAVEEAAGSLTGTSWSVGGEGDARGRGSGGRQKQIGSEIEGEDAATKLIPLFDPYIECSTDDECLQPIFRCTHTNEACMACEAQPVISKLAVGATHGVQPTALKLGEAGGAGVGHDAPSSRLQATGVC